MKTTLKRVLSIALALVLLIGALPLQTFAEDDVAPAGMPPTPGDDGAGGTAPCAAGHHWVKKDENTHVCTGGCGNAGQHSGGTATCSEQAVCSWCGAAYGEKLEHTGGTATCAAKAVCTQCHQEYGEKDPANHTGETYTVAAVPATCTTNGKTAEIRCSGCKALLSGGEEVPASHTFVANERLCQVAGCTAENPNYVAPAVVTVDFFVDNVKKQTATINEVATIQELINKLCTVDDSVALEYVSAIANNQKADLSTKVEPGQTATIYLKTQTPPTTNQPDNNTGSNTGSSNTTTPPATTKYNVYYNVNVDETSKENKLLGEYPAGTPMSTILSNLALKDIKFPGLFQDWFYIEGWYLPNGAKADANDVNWGLYENNIVLTAKWKQKYNYEVVLKLYTNGNTNTVVKVIDAFKYVQDDGRLSHTEVTNIANEYIKSNNDAPLTIYGPFDASGWEQYSLYPNRLTGTEYVEVNRYGTTVVHAMVHNAKINGSSTTNNKKADSSNPKTGDMIMMPAAVMGVSVSALAVMFYLKKKRAY